MNKITFITCIYLLLKVQLLVSCNRDDNQSVMKISKKELSSEELFKSIMFGVGDYSRSIPSLRGMNEIYESYTPKQKQEINEKLDELILSIKKKDTLFFNEFKQLIVSDEHYNVKKAIEKSSYKIADNMSTLVPNFDRLEKVIEKDIKSKNYITSDNQINEELLKKKEEEYKKILSSNFISAPDFEQREMGCSVAVGCVAYFALAVHNTVAVTANVAVVMAAWKWLAITSDLKYSGDDQTIFKVERLVNDIVIAS